MARPDSVARARVRHRLEEGRDRAGCGAEVLVSQIGVQLGEPAVDAGAFATSMPRCAPASAGGARRRGRAQRAPATAGRRAAAARRPSDGCATRPRPCRRRPRRPPSGERRPPERTVRAIEHAAQELGDEGPDALPAVHSMTRVSGRSVVSILRGVLSTCPFRIAERRFAIGNSGFVTLVELVNGGATRSTRRSSANGCATAPPRRAARPSAGEPAWSRSGRTGRARPLRARLRPTAPAPRRPCLRSDGASASLDLALDRSRLGRRRP
jgi:hypothetical protein